MFNRKKYLLYNWDYELNRYEHLQHDQRINLERVYAYELEIGGEILMHNSTQTPFYNKDIFINTMFKFNKKDENE